MGLWEEMFERLGQGIGQVLLTRNDIADHTQWGNAKKTLDELLKMGFIPIVNENDTLAVSEIKFGDNDTLSAITAGMVGADYLFLMTDVDCLYDSNPRSNPAAKPIEVVENILDLNVDVSSAGSALGTGGMSTKIVAARLATAAGITTIITRSSLPGNIAAITSYLEAKKAADRDSRSGQDKPFDSSISTAAKQRPPLHTRFLPSLQRVRDRPFWLLHGLTTHGTVYVDHGAARALSAGRNLLPVGVIDAKGEFSRHECVSIVESSRAQTDGNATTATTSSHARANSTPHRPLTHRITSSNSSLKGTAQAPLDPPEAFALHSASGNNGSRSGTSTPSPSSSQILPSVGPAQRTGLEIEIGRAIVNYSVNEIKLIAGLKSTEITTVLEYADTDYVAFRDNVALFLDQRSSGLESVGTGGDKDAEKADDGTSGKSGATTPVPGTPSMGRVGMGLGGYVNGPQIE